MNETRGNSRTKPMKRGDFRGEMNSLKDSEKTNEELDIIDLAFIYRTKYKSNNKYRTSKVNRTIFALNKIYRIEFLNKLNNLVNEYSKTKYSKLGNKK